MELKALVSASVIALTLVGYGPYIWNIINGKTRPHAFTWFPVSITAFVAFGLQVLGGAGVGAWPMLVIAFICVIVFALSLWRGTKDITVSDGVFLLLSLIALYLWLVVQQPVLSLLLITVSETLSFIPTVRKSWKDPYSETLSLYQISMFRHGLSVFALEQMNILTALYPIVWALINVAITLIIVIRRRRVRREAA